ncbi:uncharacterized protein LOC122572729 isoform X2 [Bombus pyrosoma]|uniref:uncharacterized protein LOC122572729 isoform X2 n=1 Tax=Bombus pyrosoma TaxID=396416 RepID=UPI001CB88D69|nr:uncharacterized protein LOC122572729 isoform X2 [Bombus pyrosoma]
MLQITEGSEIFYISYYNKIERYIQLLGQDPRHKSSTRNIIVMIVMINIASIIFPTIIEILASLHNKDIDGVIECLPHFLASSISAVKILNMYFNRRSFDKLFQLVAKQWQELKLNDELHILEETVMQGNRMAQFYHNTLVSFLGLFLLVPLIFPILDIVHPINGTRTRQQLLRVNYIFFNGDDYFFYIYLQLFCAAAVVVFVIISADWLYMLIIHHVSGLFAVCGHRVQKATVNPNNSTCTAVSENYMYEKIRNCAMMHSEAILFYNILNGSSQGSYLIQVGLSMLGISTTAAQIVINLDRPEEAMRSAVFCGASQFHLLLLSLPGQVLLDHCSDLADNIYSSTWYGTPVQVQKVLYVMQIRCKRFCSLTAGGLYEMNIENFGITFKTCMSYITMFMSLKD